MRDRSQREKWNVRRGVLAYQFVRRSIVRAIRPSDDPVQDKKSLSFVSLASTEDDEAREPTSIA